MLLSVSCSVAEVVVRHGGDYDVKLDSFEGPLDLLLHLVVKNEMDINDIPMAQITEQYLNCLEQMEAQNIDIASEFLVMAATLMHIKSKMLLPLPQVEPAEDEDVDPRIELVNRLLEYQRYKDGAQQLEHYPQLERDVFVRCDSSHFDDSTTAGADAMGGAGDVGLFELVKAFSDILSRLEKPQYHEIYKSDFTVAEAVRRLRDMLGGCDQLLFSACFNALPSRAEVVMMFIAVLELVKLHECKIVQLNPRGSIYIYSSQ